MRPLTLAVWSVLFAGAAVGQEKASPLPRTRLDPVTRTAVAEPVKTTVAAGTVATPPGIVTMDRYVVKGKYPVLMDPAAPAETTGPFTLMGGGRFYGKELGAARIEVGLWKNVDIFAKDSNFKPERQATKQLFDFVRMSW